MSRTNEVSLGAAIESMLSELNLRHGVYEAKIEAMWESVMGRTIAKHTTQINLKGDLMIFGYIYLISLVLVLLAC